MPRLHPLEDEKEEEDIGSDEEYDEEEQVEYDEYDDHDEVHPDGDHTRYYTRLGLNRHCSVEDVQRAYKQLSRVFHPDKTTLSRSTTTSSRRMMSSIVISHENLAASAEATFVELQHCVAVLTDRVLRLAYDTGGSTAVRLVQQSQSRQQQQAQHQQQSTTTEDDEDEDDGESCITNLYANMASAMSKSTDAAVFLLQQALQEYRHLKRQHQQYSQRGQGGASGSSSSSSPIHFDAFLYTPYSDFWEREAAALSVGLKKHLSPQKAITVSTSHRLQHRGVGYVSASVGCEYIAVPPPIADSSSSRGHRHYHRGGGGGTTTYAADARFATNTSGSSHTSNDIGSSDSPNNNNNRRQKNRPPANKGFFLLDAPYLSFRTSRQLASGTNVMLGLSGKFLDKQTWNYTLSSSRFLQLFLPQTETRKHKEQENEENEQPQEPSWVFRGVMATWKLGLHCMTGRLGFATAHFRTVSSPSPTANNNASSSTSLSIPQYLLRLSATSPYPVKVTYRGGSNNNNNNNNNNSRSSDNGNFVVSYSHGWWNLWHRLKVTWCQRVGGGRYTCQYGLKYDGRALADLSAGNIALWTLLMHVHSSEWSIRIPIFLTATSGSMPNSAATMVTILVGQWVEAQLDQWTSWKQQQDQQRQRERQQQQQQQRVPSKSSQRKSSDDGSYDGSFTTILMHTLPHVMREAAAKKRLLESKIDGLVILSVSVNGGHDHQKELTDLLQFWVTQSTLTLPTQELLLPFDTTQEQPKPNNQHHLDTTSPPAPWWKQKWWLPFFRGGISPATTSTTNTRHHEKEVVWRLDVRYQYRGFVYDSFFTQDDDIIVLPNNKDPSRSTQLGRAHQVH